MKDGWVTGIAVLCAMATCALGVLFALNPKSTWLFVFALLSLVMLTISPQLPKLFGAPHTPTGE